MGAAIQSFLPVLGAQARVLILGSIPGHASLQAQQYYAHPRNQFWPIMGRLCGAGPELEYSSRCQRLQDCGIALWDVIGGCRRVGSLDADIERDSVQINALRGLIEGQSALKCVACNGATAWRHFCQQVLADFEARYPGCSSRLADQGVLHLPGAMAVRSVRLVALPSTSPAHAAMNLDDKWQRWRQLEQFLESSSLLER